MLAGTDRAHLLQPAPADRPARLLARRADDDPPLRAGVRSAAAVRGHGHGMGPAARPCPPGPRGTRHRFRRLIRQPIYLLDAALASRRWRSRVANLLQDVRFAFRLLLRNPGVALVAIVSLALGIGANTTVFTLVKAVLLQPMPIRDIDRVVVVAIKRGAQRGADRKPRHVASELRGPSQPGQRVQRHLDHGVHADRDGGRRGAGAGVRPAGLRVVLRPAGRAAGGGPRLRDRGRSRSRGPAGHRAVLRSLAAAIRGPPGHRRAGHHPQWPSLYGHWSDRRGLPRHDAGRRTGSLGANGDVPRGAHGARAGGLQHAPQPHVSGRGAPEGRRHAGAGTRQRRCHRQGARARFSHRQPRPNVRAAAGCRQRVPAAVPAAAGALEQRRDDRRRRWSC